MSTDTRESIDVDLGYIYRSIQRSWLLATGAFTACVALALFGTTQITPKYQADAKLLFTKVDRTAALAGFNNTETGELQSLLLDQSPLTTEIEIITSRPLIQETIKRLDLRDEEGNPLDPEILAQGIEPNIIGGTDVVELLYADPDPELASAVVNTLIDVYREYSINTNRAEAREAKEFLLAQLPQTEESVRQADQALRDFLQQNNIGVLEEEARSLVTGREALEGQISTVESNLRAAAARLNLLQSTLQLNSQEAFNVGALRENPGVQEVLLALQTIERDLASQQARYNDNSPVVRQLIAERESLIALLEQEISDSSFGNSVSTSGRLIQGDSVDDGVVQTLIQDFLSVELEYEGLAQQLAVLRAYEADYENRINAIPSLTFVQRELERRVEVAEGTYQNLLTRLQELQVRENEATYNTRVIQPATIPTQPVSGEKIKILALGVIGGGFLAILIIVVSEVFRLRGLANANKQLAGETPESELDVAHVGARE